MEQVSSWQTTQAVPLTRTSFLDMLEGRTPLIHMPHFITNEQSAAIAQHLMPIFEPYIHATGPAVEKVGVAQFEFQAQSATDFENRSGDEQARYFTEADIFRSFHDELGHIIGDNIWKKVTDAIAALVPEWDVGLAKESEDKIYYSGIFRKINKGTPIHCDWCPYDCLTEDWILSKISCQAVFNLYITPTRGGSTTIHDVQWTADALKYRNPANYGYWPELVQGRRNVRFQPEVGDLYLFNSRNMHEVEPVDPEWKIPRLALASFMGVLEPEVTGGRPKLMFWS